MSERLIQRVLVADRGPAVLRIARSAAELGIETVACFAQGDAEADWPDRVDYAAYVPAERGIRWPDPDRVVGAALDAGCDAIHPGWSGLARNSALAQTAALAGLGWVGPPLALIAQSGDRLSVRDRVASVGIEVVPGTESLEDLAAASAWLAWSGVPVLVRGGGANKAHICRSAGEAEAHVSRLLARGPVWMERLLRKARAVEVVVVGDASGDVVPIGVIETTARSVGGPWVSESPPADMAPDAQQELMALGLLIGRALGWRGLGSVRLLLSADGRPYFLQMVPGLAPWHLALEAAYGVDLVDAQLRLAQGDALSWPTELAPAAHHALAFHWMAIGPGTLSDVVAPAGVSGLCAVESGMGVLGGECLGLITPRGPTRHSALVLAKSQLDSLDGQGAPHNLEALRTLASDPRFWGGSLDREQAAHVLAGVGRAHSIATAPEAP